MFEARDYQDDAYARCGKILGDGGHPLVILATGTGKTEIAGMLTVPMLKHDRPALFLAHREILLNQADQKIHKHTGVFPAREQGKLYATNAPFVTGSVQTMQGDRLERWPRDYFKYIFVDECHRAAAPSYQNVFDWFEGAQRIGLTATADRPDGKPLTPTFSEIAMQYSLSRAIRDGHLCRIIGKKVKNFQIDLSELRVAGNDYTDDDVAHVIEEYLVEIAHNVEKETKDRNKVLLFMPDVESSELLAETMREMGMSADHVSGKRKDNNEVLARFKAGEIKYLASCALLVEGYDEPAIDCVVMLRPTLSRIVYSQAIGRGTRKHDSKDNLLLLEFTYNSNKHKLVTAYELIGGTLSDRVIESAERNNGDGVDFLAALEDEYERHYSVSRIVARACATDLDFASFNPLDIGDLVEADLDSSTKAWFEGKELKGSITIKQDEILRRYMVNTEEMTKAQASTLISRLTEQKYLPMKGYASHAQMSYLRTLHPGQKFPEHLTKAAASMLIQATMDKKGQEVQKWTE